MARKPLLKENTIRRFMKLSGTSHLSEQFVNEQEEDELKDEDGMDEPEDIEAPEEVMPEPSEEESVPVAQLKDALQAFADAIPALDLEVSDEDKELDVDMDMGGEEELDMDMGEEDSLELADDDEEEPMMESRTMRNLKRRLLESKRQKKRKALDVNQITENVYKRLISESKAASKRKKIDYNALTERVFNRLKRESRR